MDESIPLEDDWLLHQIGASVRAQRLRAGLSMRALAKLAGVSQPFLSQIENGISAPSMSTAYKLARAMGIVASDLLPVVAPDLVTVVRAGEGQFHPLSDGLAPGQARVLVDQSDRLMTVAEYTISPGEQVSGWFHADGDVMLYVVHGQLEVEVEDVGLRHLQRHDLIYHAAATRYRWAPVDQYPVHVLVVTTRPWGDPAKTNEMRVQKPSL